MHFVYILESGERQHWYVGLTNDLERRLGEHTVGKSKHTGKYSDWHLKMYIAFQDRMQAYEFERYLKSHSGRAFSKKHF